MTQRILYIFTRTPLHVGAAASVGAIDQPIQRERHTGFPIIPASSLKGTFADAWNDGLQEELSDDGEAKRVRVKKGYDLQLKSVTDLSEVSAQGRCIVIVARDVAGQLHFRVFDGNGKKVVDTSETEFPTESERLGALKLKLASLWDQRSLTTGQKRSVIETVTSIVGHALASDAAWLFGSDDANNAWAGSLQFSEARLLAFPIRSARGSFAWITCPLMLRRAVRDGALKDPNGSPLTSVAKKVESQMEDESALFSENSPLALRPVAQPGGIKVVLEEYTFTRKEGLPDGLADSLQQLLPNDEVWKEIGSRLVVLSDGMMSFFAQNACEVAQHVRINDETGTAAGGALFNQENVPSEALFFSVLHCFSERSSTKKDKLRTSEQAAEAFSNKLSANGNVFQFGGDASTGLGYCTVQLANGAKTSALKTA